MAISAETIRQLHPYETRILHTLERLMGSHSWVPLDLIRKRAGFSESETLFRLGTLMEKGMVRYDVVPYEGYSLTFLGADTLALLSLSRQDTLSALGPLVGEGKESVVYEGLGLGRVAVKCHHVGQRSFQSVRLSREYIAEKTHCPWIFASRASAEREYEALKRLHPGARVPLPVGRNRNVIVMEFIEGTTLNRTRPADPAGVLAAILEQVAIAYSLGVIHADLSEFNVMLDRKGVVLIDWPQWVTPDHPNAGQILARDVENILRYFNRKFGIVADSTEEIARVTG
ncbi:MAG TPA: RIO1 family regulatory kinase/ATPase [Methanolinea sp.]|jgi:RIO kinase 2|nr:RIO1 family regulatory kinase/ATPase [Methanolinea sp.]HRS93415.1 RIO1 family regulatory kinase/ATPase [Methanolinea sp.]